MSNNLRHWSALCKTDPKHTKPFQRAGGFKGTAMRPIYMTKALTEHFGPCGVGWGMTEPQFQVVSAGDETLVYCTVGLWYRDGEEVGTPVYGVGGDKAVGKNKNGAFADDEAFKKAYTDALSNAMKQIGVGADVHMGMFEDAKYVNELRKEFAEEEAAPAPKPQSAPASPGADDLKAQAEALVKKLKDADTLFKLDDAMEAGRDLCKKLPQKTYDYIGKIYEQRRTAMEQAA